MKKQSNAAKIRVLLAEGVSVQDIAKKLKLKTAYVHQIKFYWRHNMKKGDTVKNKNKLGKIASTKAALTPVKPPIFAGLKKADEVDLVNKPPHYRVGGIETIDFIEAKNLSYHLGNAVKYISRAYYKENPLQDLKKARFYLDREIVRRESPKAA